MVLTVVILWPLTGPQSIVYLCSVKSLIYEIKIGTTGSYQQHRQSFASDGSHSTVLSGWKHLSKNTKDRKCLKHDFSFFPSRQVWFRFFSGSESSNKKMSSFGLVLWHKGMGSIRALHFIRALICTTWAQASKSSEAQYAGWKSWGRSRAQWLLWAWALAQMMIPVLQFKKITQSQYAWWN